MFVGRNLFRLNTTLTMQCLRRQAGELPSIRMAPSLYAAARGFTKLPSRQNVVGHHAELFRLVTARLQNSSNSHVRGRAVLKPGDIVE